MGRKKRSESDDVLTIAPRPSFSRCGRRRATRRHKGSRCTPANAAHSPPRRSPAPARARHGSAPAPQTAKLTLSQLINRLLPQRAPKVFRYPEKNCTEKLRKGGPGSGACFHPPLSLRPRPDRCEVIDIIRLAIDAWLELSAVSSHPDRYVDTRTVAGTN